MFNFLTLNGCVLRVRCMNQISATSNPAGMNTQSGEGRDALSTFTSTMPV